MGWAGGLYLLATGAVTLWGAPATGLPRQSSSGKLLSAAGSVLTGAGFALVLLHSDLLFGVIAALGLGAAAGMSFSVVRRLREATWIGIGFLALAAYRGLSPKTAPALPDS